MADMNGFDSAHLRIARSTNNIDALLPFYIEGLGMSVRERFGAHEGPYHLEFTSKRGHDAGRAPTQDDLLVFYLPNEQEHDAATMGMIKADFPPVRAFNPYWDRFGVTFEDPDGYRVVLAKQKSTF
ncbi:hypothetical protein SEPCBS57363_002128 [Sporothrix epigloea]|uniref:VOC domain-containing protein n=1 Tax=Sporothrix epigloea TaxID=1892477 RepID=A0ABP0DFU0_9PEZI